MNHRRTLLCVCLLSAASAAGADVIFAVKGVEDPLKANVLEYVEALHPGGRVQIRSREFSRVLDDAIREARIALRPYGYYAPEVTGRVNRNPAGEPVFELTISPGPPVRISEVILFVEGPGARSRQLREWQEQWPLSVGSVLNQDVWEEQKRRGIDLADAQGYLNAEYVTHTLEVNLETNTAAVNLVMNTGPRFVMGKIDYGEHILRPGVVENVPRFDPGDPYTSRLMDNFRADLWKTGYFTDIDVTEQRRADENPPRVDLKLDLDTRKRDFLQGALGYGTDTELRVNANWSRRPMSSRGDRLDVGLGWQEFNDEVALRTTYRVPRLTRQRQFWTFDFTGRFENQDFIVTRSDDDPEPVRLANGDIEEFHFRPGRLKVRNSRSGNRQLLETMFVQYLNSENRFQLIDPAATVIGAPGEPIPPDLLGNVENAISIGIEFDLFAIEGKGFESRGHRERAWVFTSQEAWGSGVEFTQLYLSSRRSWVYGDRWKFIARAEVGYTDAAVDDVTVTVDGENLTLSVTRLPNFYRFKAGGSASVRGYGFERLSNNNIGSNNVITASAEVEFKFLPSWSVAAFADIGNAFNDWSDPDLRLGLGVGIRWYSIAGPIRVDVAQATDFADRPWRLHFTMGTPLL